MFAIVLQLGNAEALTDHSAAVGCIGSASEVPSAAGLLNVVGVDVRRTASQAANQRSAAGDGRARGSQRSGWRF